MLKRRKLLYSSLFLLFVLFVSFGVLKVKAEEQDNNIIKNTKIQRDLKTRQEFESLREDKSKIFRKREMNYWLKG